jgi:hypothetical protein
LELAHSKLCSPVFSKLRNPLSSVITSRSAPHDCRRVVASRKVAFGLFDKTYRIPNRHARRFSGWNPSRARHSACSSPLRVSFERLKGVETHPARSETAPPSRCCRRPARSEIGASHSTTATSRTPPTPTRVCTCARRIANGFPREGGGKSLVVVFFVPSLRERWEPSPCTCRWWP